MIECLRCKETKQDEFFSNDRSRPSGKYPYCMSCQSKTTRPEQDKSLPLNGHRCKFCDVELHGHFNRRYCSKQCKARATDITKKFKLTLDEYRALFSANEGRCPICLEPSERWCIDHNHNTGRVVGVICNQCNIGIVSHSQHDVEKARRLVAYLENPPAAQLNVDVLVNESYFADSKIHRVWEYKTQQREALL